MITETSSIMPSMIFLILVFISLLSIAYSWLVVDNNSYTDVIAVLISTISTGICSYAAFGGIGYDVGDTLAVFQSNALGYFFLIMTVISGLFFALKIFDVFQAEVGGKWMKQ